MNRNKKKQDGNGELFVFIGCASDADEEGEAIYGLEYEVQKELRRLREARSPIPYTTVKFWKWDKDASNEIGGQRSLIEPYIKRAQIAVFVFKDRIGQVTWEEIESCRSVVLPKKVIALFPSRPPDSSRMEHDKEYIDGWQELTEKKQSLTKDWTVRDAACIVPCDYTDIDSLKTIAVERLKKALRELAAPLPKTLLSSKETRLRDGNVTDTLIILLFILNIIPVTVWLWNFPEALFNHTFKVIAVAGELLAAIAGLFGMQVMPEKFRNSIRNPAMRLCILTFSLIVWYCMLPFRTVYFNLGTTDTELTDVYVKEVISKPGKDILDTLEGFHSGLVDGNVIKVDGLYARRYHLIVSAEGYKEEEKELSFFDFRPFRNHFDMTLRTLPPDSISFFLDLAGNDTASDVFIDGVKAAIDSGHGTRFQKIKVEELPKKYMITVISKNDTIWENAVRIASNDTITVPSFAAVTSQRPSFVETVNVVLIIPSYMSGADVFVDGRPARIVSSLPSRIQIRVTRKKSRHNIRLIHNNDTCETDQFIDTDGRVTTPCQ